jgi:site-specific recombinase XerD
MSAHITTIDTTTTLAPATASAPSIDTLIAGWLHQARGRTGSERTYGVYAETLAGYRQALARVGLDVDGEPRACALVLQAYAAARVAERAEQGEVSASTYNQRVATVSSFYTYAQRYGSLTTNPAALVQRRKVQAYARAEAIEPGELGAMLAAIDTTTREGKRDYALLLVALATGRRLNELAALRWQDVSIAGDSITLTTRRAKGGKVMRDTLPAAASRALLDYLRDVYPRLPGGMAAEAPLWVSCSRATSGKALSARGIAYMCEQRIGTSKVHTLRHTFAHLMERTGAKASEIQRKLGHASLATRASMNIAATRRKVAQNPLSRRAITGQFACVCCYIGRKYRIV